MVDEILRLAAKKTLVIEEVSEEIRLQRIATCEGCERFNSEHRKCLECGCYIDVKAGCKNNRNPKKLRFEITHCPLGKWGDKETANEYRRIDGKQLLN